MLQEMHKIDSFIYTHFYTPYAYVLEFIAFCTEVVLNSKYEKKEENKL